MRNAIYLPKYLVIDAARRNVTICILPTKDFNKMLFTEFLIYLNVILLFS